MTDKKIGQPYVRGNYGHNLHTVRDIFLITSGLSNEPFDDNERFLEGVDQKVADASEVTVQGENGLTVWLKHDEKITQGVVRTVLSIERVEADTQEEVDRFDEALEKLEAIRAQQILDSWTATGWSTDLLRSLSNRRIMVIDVMLDLWSEGNVIKNVELLSAFERDTAKVAAEVTRKVTIHLPESECVEYIAERIGPYEFTSLESACLIRDVWNVFGDNSDVIDCMVYGMVADDHIKQLPDWTDWTGYRPYPFLSG